MGRPRWKHRVLFDWRYVPEESRRAYRLACLLFWSILLWLVFQHAVIGVGIIHEQSMLPTLSEGSYFLINKYAYRVHHPARGDIVVIRPNPQLREQYVKRVIGLPAETLLIQGGAVYLNGHRLIEPYALGPTLPDFGPYHIAPQTYFVMGDHRAVSVDSRSFGAVFHDQIEGKIVPGELFSFK